MIWNTIPNEERLRLWKKLRAEIENYSDIERMSAIAEFCSSMPFGSRTLDYYSPNDWPTPWEILFYGSFCTSSISLLMYYTLVLLDDPTPVELLLVEDDDGIYLLPLIDNQYILNYELGKVSNHPDIKEHFKILKTYTRSDVKIT